MKKSRSEQVANWYSRYFPDAFIFALVLTIIAMLLSLFLTESSVGEVMDHWFAGFPWLFEFAFQLMFTYAAALVLVDTPVVQKYVKKTANLVKTPMTAYVTTSVVGALTSFIGWYIGPVVTAIFARSVGREIPGVDYRLISAIAYSSFTISLTGISGTIPLFVATEGEFTDVIGGIVGLEQTTFSTLNIVSAIAIIITTTIIYMVIAKNKTDIVTFHDLATPEFKAAEEQAGAVDPDESNVSVEEIEEKSFADKVNTFRPLILIVGIVGLVYLIYFLGREGLGGLNLNTVAFIALVMGLLVQKDAVSYARSFSKNLIATGSIGLQFPIYGGIASILVGTGLAATITDAIVSVSTEVTFPVLAFLTTGLLNLFVPSAGSQFTATATFWMPAAETLGVDSIRTIMAITYGDIWTNLIQPFWALLYFPILAVGTNLKVRDFMGYCLPVLIAVGVIWILSLLFLPV
ncbi:TIGR00366 family protein [Alteribacillus iranensis]|uniref:Short-chain fatty acids transporter n=1 Tax=Alteribacillus iranensis TaxID=930128 RepID=A0A1I2BPA9_9BACI|nr:TIGR00366 family protein [Alteribacillus iranensis]SFE57951.1 short-chain fatty acids transporter [Alteribacillus iranensis]